MPRNLCNIGAEAPSPDRRLTKPTFTEPVPKVSFVTAAAGLGYYK
jgi:hypothetical protein